MGRTVTYLIFTCASLERRACLESVCGSSVDMLHFFLFEIWSPFNHCRLEPWPLQSHWWQLATSAPCIATKKQVGGLVLPLVRVAAACLYLPIYWVLSFCHRELRLQAKEATASKIQRGGGGRKQRRETQELFNFTLRGRSHDIQPRVEVSYFFTLLWTAGLGTCQHSGGSYIRASFFPGI